jgi:hypothetical protein
MLNYITFKTNEEFTDWQRNMDEGTVINSITPIMQDIKLDTLAEKENSYTETMSGGLDLSVGVFVVYSN